MGCALGRVEPSGRFPDQETAFRLGRLTSPCALGQEHCVHSDWTAYSSMGGGGVFIHHKSPFLETKSTMSDAVPVRKLLASIARNK